MHLLTTTTNCATNELKSYGHIWLARVNILLCCRRPVYVSATVSVHCEKYIVHCLFGAVKKFTKVHLCGYECRRNLFCAYLMNRDLKHQRLSNRLVLSRFSVFVMPTFCVTIHRKCHGTQNNNQTHVWKWFKMDDINICIRICGRTRIHVAEQGFRLKIHGSNDCLLLRRLYIINIRWKNKWICGVPLFLVFPVLLLRLVHLLYAPLILLHYSGPIGQCFLSSLASVSFGHHFSLHYYVYSATAILISHAPSMCK